MPYQSGGERRINAQLGAGRPSVQSTAASLLGERLYDSIPGTLAWLSVVFALVGTLYAPIVPFTVAVCLGVYTAGRMALAALSNLNGLRLIRKWETTDWRRRYEQTRHRDSLEWEDVLHVVIIPNYQEDLAILRQTLSRFAASPLSKTQVCIVLAMEASERDAEAKALTLQQEFSDCFKAVLFTLHPKGISGELQVKSANVAWAARNAKRQLVNELGYSLDHLLVTSCDADSLVHPRYLEATTCLFANSKRRYNCFWHGPIRYHSNVWDVHPAVALVQAYGSAWELAYMSAPWWHPLPISTYSLSMRLAHEVGYWDSDVIADEVHMFVKCFARRAGDLHLIRVFLPFSVNSVTGNTLWDLLRNRYLQTVRHAWGAKEIGYTISQLVDRPDIPPLRGLIMLISTAHDHVLASAGWMMITFGQLLPLLLKPRVFAGFIDSPLGVTLQAAYLLVGILGIVFWLIDLRIRPRRPRRWTLSEATITLLSLLLLPLLTVFLVTVPALQAQTRLMVGIPLRFRVTRKT